MTDVKRVFMVDAKPFFPIGSEFLNMAGYSVGDESETEEVFKAVKAANGNTALISIYWDQIELEEGKFDLTSVDIILNYARRYGVRLIFLWFGTWKNGNMDFTPEWIKTNPKRFKRVLLPNGSDIWVLSPHCKANLEADRKAFVELCKHLKTKDGKEHTVIGIQVENEPGILGSDRDYGPEAQAEFNSPVPARLVTAMKAAGKGTVYDMWQEAGGKKSGTWPELFNLAASEFMTAWSFATYIDSVAKAGKAVYDIPMYINVWVMQNSLWTLPGEIYPSGGAVSKVLDIYKWFTPHVDMISPDDSRDFSTYKTILASYARDDNPLFAPECVGGPNMFRAIADYNAIGWTAWIQISKAEDGSVHYGPKMSMDSIRCVSAVIPLLLKYQGTGKIHAIIEEADMEIQRFDFDGYMGAAVFGGGQAPLVAGKDWQHTPASNWPHKHEYTTEGFGGYGLVIQASRNEFYLVGTGYRFLLRHKNKIQSPTLKDEYMFYTLRVEEGHFDQNGEFVVDRRRNGDRIAEGVWVEPDIGVVRVIMCD